MTNDFDKIIKKLLADSELMVVMNKLFEQRFELQKKRSDLTYTRKARLSSMEAAFKRERDALRLDQRNRRRQWVLAVESFVEDFNAAMDKIDRAAIVLVGNKPTYQVLRARWNKEYVAKLKALEAGKDHLKKSLDPDVPEVQSVESIDSFKSNVME